MGGGRLEALAKHKSGEFLFKCGELDGDFTLSMDRTRQANHCIRIRTKRVLRLVALRCR